MDPLCVLPAEPLRRGLYFSERFLSLGAATFREAARYVQQMPYGPNRTPATEESLFRDGCGTCTSKHGAIAVLASELELPVKRWRGLYRLDENIVARTGEILESYRIPFVPAGHCFLVYQDHRVDLTAGNNNGKMRDVTDFLAIWPDPPVQCPGRGREQAEEFVKLLLRSDSAFGHLSLEEMQEVQARCMTCMRENRIRKQAISLPDH